MQFVSLATKRRGHTIEDIGAIFSDNAMQVYVTGQALIDTVSGQRPDQQDTRAMMRAQKISMRETELALTELGVFAVQRKIGAASYKNVPELFSAIALSDKIETVSHMRTVHVIRWMDYEYEQGWRTYDACRDDEPSVYSSLDAAKAHIDSYIKNRGGAHLSGEMFSYPTGPDHQYVIYSFDQLSNHPVHQELKAKGIVLAKNHTALYRDIINGAQSHDAARTVIFCPGLAPKPIKDPSKITFWVPGEPQIKLPALVA